VGRTAKLGAGLLTAGLLVVWMSGSRQDAGPGAHTPEATSPALETKQAQRTPRPELRGRASVIAGAEPGFAPGGWGVTIRGRVLDRATRRPLPEARVRIEPHGEPVMADAEGHYELGPVPLRSGLLVTASAPAYQTLRTSVIGAWPHTGQEELDLPLLPAPRLWGRVLDEVSGRPIGDASVEFSGPGGASSTLSDVRGRFELQPPGPAGWLWIRAPGRASARLALDVSDGTQAEPLEIRLQPAFRLAGRITDPDGLPVAGARVRVGQLDRFDTARETVSNAAGELLFDDLAGGAVYRLLVTHPDFLSHVGEPFWLGPAAPAPAQDVRLRPAGGIAGSVFTDRGEPAAGVELTVRSDVAGARAVGPLGADLIEAFTRPSFDGADLLGIPLTAQRTVTAEDGSFLLQPLAAGIHEVRLGSDRQAREQVEGIRLQEGERVRGLALLLSTELEIRGTARTTSGLPLAGVWIAAVADDGSLEPELTSFQVTMWMTGSPNAVTDENGAYVLGLAAPGRFRVLVRFRGTLQQREIEAPAEGVDFSFPAGTRIQGTVVDATDGRPVQEIHLATAAQAGSLSSSKPMPFVSLDGSFELESLEAEDVFLMVWARGYRQTQLGPIRLAPGQAAAQVRIELPRAPAVTGFVRDEAGDPVAGAIVRMYDGWLQLCRQGLSRAHVPTRVTDADGRFELPCWRPGPAALYIERSGFAPAELRLQIGEEPGPLEVRLSGGLHLRGRVASPRSGRPGAGLVVEAAGYGAVTTAPDGSFELQDLPAARHTITVREPLAWRKIVAQREVELHGDLDGLRIELASPGD
jgi:protocatechuate 3,4-dioxygenase beta subunit